MPPLRIAVRRYEQFCKSWAPELPVFRRKKSKDLLNTLISGQERTSYIIIETLPRCRTWYKLSSEGTVWV